MTVKAINDAMLWVEPLACVAALVLMYRKRQLRTFGYLAAYLLSQVVSDSVMGPLLAMSGRQIPLKLGYIIYYWVYWSSYAIEALLGFGIVYSIYNLAMAPLKGLQRLGKIMFIWATGIAVVVAATTTVGPNVTTGLSFLRHATTQLQQTQAVITLCLLLFVTMAIRPMGLSYRSKVFGVSLGLGLLATSELAGVAWVSHVKHMMATYNLVQGIIFLSAIGIWSGYLAIPEPRRRMIILPTTSPFLRWNQISLALGDDPGFVAVGDITPDMFAPAEVEVMRRASVKMTKAATG